jgi:glycosyltransferase involved in cell wall biosynthesis
MKVVQITPGAGGMFCGNCLRDNALVAELRRLGHETLMVPLYLPLRLDEQDQSAGVPVFFGGVNVYLDQKWPWYRRLPGWLRRPLDSARVLRWAAGRAAKTRASEVGDLTLSMLRGEEGNQRRDLDDLVAWLAGQGAPEVLCLSNLLLLGMARSLREGLGTRVVCLLKGEEAFLDAMPEPFRSEAWRTLASRGADVDCFVAPSHFFAEEMARRLELDRSRIRVIPNGINLDGYPAPLLGARSDSAPAAIGFFARLCRDKGLDTLVDAYIELRRRPACPPVRLRVGGSLGPADEPWVETLKERLERAGFGNEVDWHPNLSRSDKIEFLRSLTLFSVPARCGESFGLYLVEAMAAGVPVVQPRVAAFPELLEATGGGVLYEPESATALAAQWEALLRDPARVRALGEAGHRAVFRDHSIQRMAERMLEVFRGEPLRAR